MTAPIEMAAFKIMAETGLSARELAEMDLSEYARLTGRPTPAEAALRAVEAQHQPPAQHGQPQPQKVPQTVPAEQPDPLAMTWEEYAQWRDASGLAARSAEGMSRASLSMSARYVRNDVPVNGRRQSYSGN
ncbi:MAG TPA: hypothetical protein VFO01_11510 [Trebonia sp.]|nr:hypothetical protein [Trebonia sp.]